MTGIAIDDEPIALEIIRTHAGKVDFLELKAVFVSATEALAYLQKNAVDVIFLDIRMPDLSGIEVAQLAGEQAKIIFVTAYPEFAVQGFELAATDYLLKPVGFNRFLQACTRVYEQLQEKTNAIFPESILVKDGFQWVSIQLNELLYIESDDNYLIFHETGKRTMSRMTLTEVIQKLPVQKFVRVHKSFIISIPKVEKIEKRQVTIAGRLIPLSSNYRENLLQHLP